MIPTLTPGTTVDLVAGYDVGGTKVDVRVLNRSTGEVITQRYSTRDFVSLDAVLDESLTDIGARPARIFMAIAGPRRPNGDVQMTNQPHWPLFEVAKTAKRLGIDIRTVNDMVGTAAGLAALVIEEQHRIKDGTIDPAGPKLVITVSTGTNDALLLADGTPVATEGGHTTWQPMNRLERRYLKWLQRKYSTGTITVEVAVSGKQGFSNIYDFLTSEGRMFPGVFMKRYRPNKLVKNRVAEYRASGDIGVIITHYAFAGDRFCREVMNLLGSILGQYTRNRAVGTLSTGGIFFVGSVMQALGVARWLVVRTPFLERFIGKGAQHADFMREIPIFVVTEEDVAVKGALALAKR